MGDKKSIAEPLYRQVVRALFRDIESGKLPVGSRLLTEDELSRRLNVSRHTVREALRHLRLTGTIQSRQGSGSTVVNAGQVHRFVHGVSDLSELLQYAAETRLDIDRSSFVVADAALATRLNCSPGREWLRIEGLRYSFGEERPLGSAEVYVHAAYGRIWNLIGKRPGPIYSWIESEFNERVAEVCQTVRAIAMPKDLAKNLQAEVGSPALEIERVYRSERNKVIQIAFSVHPEERFSVSTTLRRQPVLPGEG